MCLGQRGLDRPILFSKERQMLCKEKKPKNLGAVLVPASEREAQKDLPKTRQAIPVLRGGLLPCVLEGSAVWPPIHAWPGGAMDLCC